MKIYLLLLVTLLFPYNLPGDTIKTITDISAWKHPVKEYLHKPPYNIYRVELTRNNTYPAFYVEKPDWRMLDDKKSIVQFVNNVAGANAFWDFELVNKKENLSLKVLCDRKKKQIAEILVNSETYFAHDSLSFNLRKGTNTYLSSKVKELLKQANYSIPYNKVCGYIENDYDLDGKKEIVLAVLDSYDKECDIPEYSYLYFFRMHENRIDSICKYLSAVEIIYSLNEIKLKNEQKPFIYCRITNGFCSNFGYAIFTLKNNQVVMHDEAFSATGVGTDYLIDTDNDHYYDTHYQNRIVFGLNVTTSYNYVNHEFVLTRSVISLNENFNFTGTVESALKIAVAIKYFLSPDAQTTYKIANIKELQNLSDEFCSVMTVPEITSLNSMNWEEISCDVKRSQNNSTEVQLKSSDLGIDADVTLEKIDGKWKIRKFNNK